MRRSPHWLSNSTSTKTFFDHFFGRCFWGKELRREEARLFPETMTQYGQRTTKKILMIITDEKKLVDIQSEFQEKFPALKLEFYSTPHQVGSGSASQELLPASAQIGTVRRIHSAGDLSINGHLKVKTLEQMFFEQYGLNVQVFRKSGDIWLQTTTTDEWTLTEQNNRGMRAMTDAN